MPKETLKLLDELQQLGMTNEQFQQLHHRGVAVSIKRHRNHCEAVDYFTADSGNHPTKARLQVALDELRRQRDVGEQRDWPVAIRAALTAHPIERQVANNGGHLNLARLTDREAVLRAMQDFDELGQKDFLARFLARGRWVEQTRAGGVRGHEPGSASGCRGLGHRAGNGGGTACRAD